MPQADAREGADQSATELHVQKSLIEQILDDTFRSLAEDEHFDPETIARIKKLTTDGGLTKSTDLRAAIVPRSEEQGENT